MGDVVSAALAAGDAEATGAINIGTGSRDQRPGADRGARRASPATTSFEPEFAPARTGEVQRITIDAGRAERELGWRAEMGLDDGLRVTLDSI